MVGLDGYIIGVVPRRSDKLNPITESSGIDDEDDDDIESEPDEAVRLFKQ